MVQPLGGGGLTTSDPMTTNPSKDCLESWTRPNRVGYMYEIRFGCWSAYIKQRAIKGLTAQSKHCTTIHMQLVLSQSRSGHFLIFFPISLDELGAPTNSIRHESSTKKR